MRGNSPTLDYITRTFVREPAIIAAARAEGEKRVSGMQISPYEGKLLQWLVQICGAKHILEIGTFMGVSTLWMADALPADGTIVSLEARAEHAALARAHVAASSHAERIKIMEIEALKWLNAQAPEARFDLVFMDAVKAEYVACLAAVEKLLKPRAWIIGDNTLLFGVLSGENPGGASAAAKDSMMAFNATLADSSRYESILLPTPEGMTVARRKS